MTIYLTFCVRRSGGPTAPPMSEFAPILTCINHKITQVVGWESALMYNIVFSTM